MKNKKNIKTFSIPEKISDMIDIKAKAKNMNRSQLVAEAVKKLKVRIEE